MFKNNTLHEDIKLQSDKYGQFDMVFKEGDIVNVTGVESLENACIIAIMTRLGELKNNPTYKDFGSRVHDLIKMNMNAMTKYKLELFITETLENMRRVYSVNEVLIEPNNEQGYNALFDITGIDDKHVKGVVKL